MPAPSRNATPSVLSRIRPLYHERTDIVAHAQALRSFISLYLSPTCRHSLALAFDSYFIFRRPPVSHVLNNVLTFRFSFILSGDPCAINAAFSIPPLPLGSLLFYYITPDWAVGSVGQAALSRWHMYLGSTCYVIVVYYQSSTITTWTGDTAASPSIPISDRVWDPALLRFLIMSTT
jgi:hypothetical protein